MSFSIDVGHYVQDAPKKYIQACRNENTLEIMLQFCSV